MSEGHEGASPTTLTKYLMGGDGGEGAEVRGGESWVPLLRECGVCPRRAGGLGVRTLHESP